MERVLGIIPARFASSRFPGKPLALINNKPMIQWVFEKVAPIFENLCVATDDERIKMAVEKAGGEVIMTSPDHRTGTERCREAFEKISSEKKTEYTHVVNIQGDEPFIKTEQIFELLSCFDSEGTDIATLIQPFEKEGDISNPNQVKVVVDRNYRALYFSRSPIPFIRSGDQGSWMKNFSYFRHTGIYAYRSKALLEITRLEPTPLELAESLEQLRWLENGYKIQTKISNYQSIGVDTPEDLENIRKNLNL
ncbi:MAG: 3-deoxy-manno-octulosonate cytidylyltransferase [Bacteroidales bacterium]|nr:3-deoxy-manno-octulosonate cytidylyltransferase [Bacteroidales bacterium]